MSGEGLPAGQVGRAESYFQQLLDFSHDVLFRRNLRTGRYEYISRSVEELLGWPVDEILAAENLEEASHCHPDDDARVRAYIEQLVLHPNAGGPPSIIEYRIVKPDGSIVWVSDSNVVVADENGEPEYVLGALRDITDKKEAEKNRRIQERGQRLFETTPDILTRFDRQFRHVSINKAGERFAQRTREEILGKTHRELGLPAETIELWESALLKVFETGEQVNLECFCPFRQDEETYLHSIIVPDDFVDGRLETVACITRDITDHYHARQSRLESERAFRAMVEQFPNGAVFLFDRDIRYLAVGGRALEPAGLTPEDLIGKVPEECFPPEVHRTIRHFCPRIFENRHIYYEVLYKGRTYENRGVPIPNEAGEINVGLVYTTDITDRKRDEEERLRLANRIQHAQKLESLGVLAGGIAHDFNNLLMGVLGNADLALREVSPSHSTYELLLDIERSARHAADLCRQMLAYSGKGRFMVRLLDLNEAVRETMRLLEASVSKKARLDYRFAEDLPAIKADPSQIHQVVMNLVTNASEAIGDDNGVISIRTSAVECTPEYLASTFVDEDLEAGTYVSLEVSDNGCGMTPDTAEKVFDPFFSTKFTGRGLGLAAVLGIVRGHRGAIKVYSEPGEGSRFRVLFPAADGVAQVDEARKQEEDTWQMHGKVLLADDEPSVRAIASRMLKRFGLEVVEATDGREAIELYRRHAGSLRAVLLDLTMPNMGGEEAFREIQRLSPAAPVIIMSGYAEEEFEERFAGKCVSGFLQKPFRFSDLKGVLRLAIERKQVLDS